MNKLTFKQRIITQYVSHGYTNKQIALLEGISESTVATHIEQARHAMDAKNRAHLVAICIREWIIK